MRECERFIGGLIQNSPASPPSELFNGAGPETWRVIGNKGLYRCGDLMCICLLTSTQLWADVESSKDKWPWLSKWHVFAAGSSWRTPGSARLAHRFRNAAARCDPGTSDAEWARCGIYCWFRMAGRDGRPKG